MANADNGQILACIAFREFDFRLDDAADERVKAGVGQVAPDARETRDDVGNDGLIDPDLPGYMGSIDFGHWQSSVLDHPGCDGGRPGSVTYISGMPAITSFCGESNRAANGRS
jgi:hypothetical protein